MLASPYLSDLLQSTASPPDERSDYSSALRAVRMAEELLRYSVDTLEHAISPRDRSNALYMRDQSLRSLIHSLQRLRIALQDTP